MNRLIIIPLTLLIFAVACNKEEQPAAPKPETALALVGDTYITKADLDKAAAAQDAVAKKYLNTDFGRQTLLNVIVREKLIDYAARQDNVQSNKKYIETVNNLETEFNRLLEQAKNEYLSSIWLENLKESGKLSVSKKEIDDYFKKYPYEMTVRHMLLTSADDANNILKELRATPSYNKDRRFRELAAKYSVDLDDTPQNAREFTFMPGEFLPEIENAAANSKTGEVQGFFKTARGFHIIYKVGEKKLTAKEAEPRIIQILERAKLDEYLNTLADKYKVEVYDENK